MYLTVCSLCDPSHASSVRERMYLTVCSLCDPSHASSVRERMYLTVCSLCDPSYASSVRERMYLTVCSVCDPGPDSIMVEWMYLFVLPMTRAMTAQWENECISLSVRSGFFFQLWLSISRDFFWPITLYQPILNQRGREWLNLSLMAPHYLWTLRRKALYLTMNTQWLKKQATSKQCMFVRFILSLF